MTASADAAVELAVSTVIFALHRDDDASAPTLRLPLVRRTRQPQRGLWALPGGPLRPDESLSTTAARTLAETTGLTPQYLEQLYAFGRVDRSPTGRVVTVVYWALVRADETANTIHDENVRWLTADALPALAFDHNLIVDYALWRLRNKMEYSRIAHNLLGDEFTLAQLREVHEVVLGRRLDPANFRRSVTASDALMPTGRRVEGTRHRPPLLYRYNTAIEPLDQGPLNPNGPERTASS